MSLALRGSREREGGGTEPFDDADVRAALRAKARQMYAKAIGITAFVTLAFTFS